MAADSSSADERSGSLHSIGDHGILGKIDFGGKKFGSPRETQASGLRVVRTSLKSVMPIKRGVRINEENSGSIRSSSKRTKPQDLSSESSASLEDLITDAGKQNLPKWKDEDENMLRQTESVQAVPQTDGRERHQTENLTR